ncbi:MAG TPA: glycosyltransferase [Candidatus Limnocylindrales bacterium]
MSHPITVVIPTAAGWPDIRLALDPLLPQLRAHGGQLIVADVSGAPPPAELRDAADIVWLERPGEWVITARREAYALAAGEVVAVTEDHCTVAADWVARVLAAHAANPHAAAITGAVENGTRDSVAEWALYVSAHVRLAPPVPPRPGLAGKSNISYKRAVLARMPDFGPGVIEDVFSQQLRGAGLEVLGDDTIRVAHHQSGSAAQMLELQFHNGRTLGGVRRAQMTATDYARALLPAPLAGFRLLRTLAVARTKALPPGALARAAPLVAALYLAHAAGETLGYLRGPGDSPRHLH